jgi:hypothetical protein
MSSYITKYVEIKGIYNFNLKEFFYGFNTLKAGPSSPFDDKKP